MIKFAALLLLFGTLASAVEKKDLQLGVFIDSYYGYDFNEPIGDRQFFTTASRHNEFSVNLAHIELKVDKDKLRGRLALQTGSSVYSNYSPERRYAAVGSSQLADVMRHIQEAYAGYQISEGLWVDAGIFFSHIGAESFLTKDNWTYTRSLGAEFSPYYQTGVRLNYQINPQWLVGMNVTNGWQDIVETNGDKALGMQIAFTPSQDFSITYNNFIGRENEFRFYNNLIFRAKLSSKFAIMYSSDLGIQKKSGGGDSIWFAETLLAQWKFCDHFALGGRAEYYHDQDQVLAITGTPNGMQTFGGSLNFDWFPDDHFLFRNEARFLTSKDDIFLGQNGARSSSFLLVSSLAFQI